MSTTLNQNTTALEELLESVASLPDALPTWEGGSY